MEYLMALLGILTLPKNYTTKLTPHFHASEIQCHCKNKSCTDTKMDYRILRALEELRTAVGNKPLAITSGFRCAKHNEKVGGKDKSRHKLGLAVDIIVPSGMNIKEFAHRARLFFDYVLEYPGDDFIHAHFHPVNEPQNDPWESVATLISNKKPGA